MDVAALIISVLAFAVAIFRPLIDNWFLDRVTVRFSYQDHHNEPRGRIGQRFAVMCVSNRTRGPITIRSLEWRIQGTGIKVAEQGSIHEYDGWRSDELPKRLPTRWSGAMWYQPTSISGEPGWEMILADKVFTRNTWRSQYRKLALYFVLSPLDVVIADMPEEFFKAIKHACELWDEHGWPHERLAANSQALDPTTAMP